MPVIQRTSNCASGEACGKRALARAKAALLGMPRRDAKESSAYPKANSGSFSVACCARTIESSSIKFSYLSSDISANLRASTDRVDTGIAPNKSKGAGAKRVDPAARDFASSTRGGCSCARVIWAARSTGKISARLLRYIRFMDTLPRVARNADQQQS